VSLEYLRSIRIGYIPYSPDLTAPSDRRRFVYFAKANNLPFSIYNPSSRYDIVIAASSRADPQTFRDLPASTKCVLDFIDSYLVEPALTPRSLLRGVVRYMQRRSSKLYLQYKDAYTSLIRDADVVICSSPEQASLISPHANAVVPIPDSHLSECFNVKSDYCLSSTLNIAWEGQIATLPAFLRVATYLSSLSDFPPVLFHVVTDRYRPSFYGWSLFSHDTTVSLAKSGIDFAFYPWSIENINNLPLLCDLAIVPVDTANPMHCFKPENRINLFWRLGLPVVASATESHVRAMSQAGFDLTASSYDEWSSKIQLLTSNPAILRAHSLSCHGHVVGSFPEAFFSRQWVSALMLALRAA